MLRSISLLLITLLITLSSQSEIKSSIPNFSDSIKYSLSAMEANSTWDPSLPEKNRSVEELGKILKTVNATTYHVAIIPESKPFEKKFFKQLSDSYQSYYSRPFHLLI